MSKAAKIRALAAEGLTTSEIAARAEVSYQHAYNVLRRGNPGERPTRAKASGAMPSGPNPPLTVAQLERGGFIKVCAWTVQDAMLVLDPVLPKARGVYAFVRDGAALYVGLATKGVLHRFRSYRRPGRTQQTSLRLNEALRGAIERGEQIEIYVAHPPDMEWNGMPVRGDAGLELGLIEAFDLPWNIRGARR